MAFYPKDFDNKSGPEIAEALFDETFDDTSSWSLTRADEKSLEWTDNRLGVTWRTTAGTLIALQEVSSPKDAQEFCERNKITLLPEGALHYRGVAEFPIVCSRLPPLPTISGFRTSEVRLHTRSGIEAKIGYASFLFQKLIGWPLQEDDPELPDPDTTATLVVRTVDRADAHLVAELALYLLREYAGGARFVFTRYRDLPGRPLADPDSGSPLTLPSDPLPDTKRAEALAFFNRAEESDPIAGFLYYYRVVEACFEDVLGALVRQWRADGSIPDADFLGRVRKLKDQEDTTGLRLVLGAIVDQRILDDAHGNGLIPAAGVDELVTGVYHRRNSVAHGRRGQHREVLVPFAFSSGRDAHDRAWSRVMRTLASRAIGRYILA